MSCKVEREVLVEVLRRAFHAMEEEALEACPEGCLLAASWEEG